MATTRDADGRQVELRTWRDESSQPDTTRWLYDRAGMVTNKVYADGLGPSYTYLADGRLSARAWARDVTTAYGYSDDASGRMQTVTYSDPTPNVTSRYDLAGRQVAVTDRTGPRTFSYNALSRQTAETNSLAVIERQYDALGRSVGYDLLLPAFTNETFAIRYAHDAVGRFSQVSNYEFHVSYAYLPGSAMIVGVTNNLGYGLIRAYEPCRDLITEISNVWGFAAIASFQYQNDAAGRRTSRVDDGAITNVFGYNLRSEVTNAVMATNLYAYLYDDIGNRISSAVSAPPRETFYTANQLNQYTEIRSAETNSPTYDAEGNMLTHGPWAYTWDAENRPITVSSNATLVVSNAYDYMSRRALKTTATTTTHFIWDGWNMVAEIAINQQTGITNITQYIWGLDLSGSLQGAGGVGGLLAVIKDTGIYYPAYDGNGNVTDYVDTNGTVVGHREYDSFGATTALTGSQKDYLHVWFSTKYIEQETGFTYFGRRCYAPDHARWTNRDPSHEEGGINLYEFVMNNPVCLHDPLGLCSCTFHRGTETSVELGRRARLPRAAGLTLGVFRLNRRSSRCGLNSWKYRVTVTPCHADIYIASDSADPAYTERHENTHFRYYERFYDSVVDAHRIWENTCLCRPCYEAVTTWLDALSDFYIEWRDFKDGQLDGAPQWILDGIQARMRSHNFAVQSATTEVQEKCR